MGTLNGKLAVVTGGSRGIGASICRHLAAQGAAVVINYARSVAAAEALVAEIAAAGGEAAAVQADLSGGMPAAKQLFAGADAALGGKYAGRCDILVNNAGTFVMSPIYACTEEQFNTVFDLNVRAVFLVTRLAVDRMGEGGRIITIGSGMADHMPNEGGAIYSMSKAAVQGLTRGWARDLGPRGITVNCVQPGPVDTDMNPADSEYAGPISRLTALGRYGHVDEVAALVTLLASPGGAYITGAMLNVDGGFTA
jgi:3-oxoacyl-[acyl-carrier protein] reductase